LAIWVAYRPRGIRTAEAVKLAEAEKHILEVDREYFDCVH
jgi:hypothetical protein